MNPILTSILGASIILTQTISPIYFLITNKEKKIDLLKFQYSLNSNIEPTKNIDIKKEISKRNLEERIKLDEFNELIKKFEKIKKKPIIEKYKKTEFEKLYITSMDGNNCYKILQNPKNLKLKILADYNFGNKNKKIGYSEADKFCKSFDSFKKLKNDKIYVFSFDKNKNIYLSGKKINKTKRDKSRILLPIPKEYKIDISSDVEYSTDKMANFNTDFFGLKN